MGYQWNIKTHYITMIPIYKNGGVINRNLRTPKMEVLYHIKPNIEDISRYLALKNRPSTVGSVNRMVVDVNGDIGGDISNQWEIKLMVT